MSGARAPGAVASLDRPLGVFENAMILTHEHSPFNVVIVLRLAGAPGAPAVRTALDALQQRQPALRAALAGRRGFRRFVPSAEPLPLEVEPRGEPARWRAAAEAELARRLPLARGPLGHARYLVGGDGEAVLLLTLAHAIVDAASGSRLVDELLTLASGGTLADGGAGLPPLPLLEERFPARFRGWRGRLRTVAALAGSLASELAFQARTRRAGLPGVDPRARSCIVTATLDVEATAALVRRSRRERVTINSALAAAFLVALARVRRGGRRLPARLYTMADLRAWVSPPLDARTLGAGWAMLRIVVEPMAPDELWPVARAVNERIRRRLAGGAKYLAYLTIRAMMRLGLAGPRLRMGEVAVSYTGPTAIARRYDSIEVTGLEVFVSNIDLGPECSVLARLHEGCLSLGLVYLDTDMDSETAGALADEALALLAAGGGEG